jgi:hypothetical protein
MGIASFALGFVLAYFLGSDRKGRAESTERSDA